jgi:2-hydroxychromene-2-carboxylate isomerase
MTRLDRHFDFISPFSYLQSELLPADHWHALLQALGTTPATLEAPEIKRQLRDNDEQAIAAGVFGVPSAVVDNRCFWGVDATDMLLAYLRSDPFFQSAQFAQAQNLPQACIATRLA